MQFGQIKLHRSDTHPYSQQSHRHTATKRDRHIQKAKTHTHRNKHTTTKKPTRKQLQSHKEANVQRRTKRQANKKKHASYLYLESFAFLAYEPCILLCFLHLFFAFVFCFFFLSQNFRQTFHLQLERKKRRIASPLTKAKML